MKKKKGFGKKSKNEYRLSSKNWRCVFPADSCHMYGFSFTNLAQIPLFLPSKGIQVPFAFVIVDM